MDGKPKVLVVDDEELSQDFLRFFLSQRFEVYTVGTVNSFYNIISKIDFHIILMDISLRDSKDGIQLTRELKATEKYRNVPIFIITAYNTTKEMKMANDAGADHFLTKPVDVKILLNSIDKVLTDKNVIQHKVQR